VSKSVNKVILLGNVGKAPEARRVSGDLLKVSLSLATNDRRKVNGEWQEFAEWHNLVFFGRTAEIARDYLRKGSKVYVEGKLHTYSYTDDQNTTRWRTDVIVNELTLLDSGQARTGGSSAPAPEAAPAEISDEDIPF
jgi:single-strand DNA-binding protein